MTKAIFEFCIYTIVHGERLAKIARNSGRGSFEERKPWVTGQKLWQRAREKRQVMPVLFADATDCSRLLFWGVLTRVSVQGDTTRFSVDQLRKLKGRHEPQELVLRRTGETIAPHFIRPYAICRTPRFVNS